MAAGEAPAWPELRDELALHAGPRSNQGAPTWSLHDPVRNLYFRIDWLTFEVLCRWHFADSEKIAQSLHKETTFRVDSRAIESIVEFLSQRELIKRHSHVDTQQFGKDTERRKRHWYTWLLHHYLFFRVPLLRPDRWLGETCGWFSWLGSRSFTIVTIMALGLGLFEVSRQWDQFTATLLDMFSLKGVLAYGATLILVKFLHELGHAYTAKHYGCKVPTMGIAFLVMFPMAYTDVNDAWRLPCKRQRLCIGAAGIRTELTLAAWATLAWVLLPDGALRNGAFLLATTTWLSTLVINASPFLRFDGYFLLMDALELPNLHQRSFALARWRLRELLFALGDEVPEYFSLRRQRFLILFACITWCYRLIIFVGIAVLVYLMFPKPLGPFLAVLEVSWFVLRPIGEELKVWRQRGNDIMKAKKYWMTLSLLVFVIAIVVIPWDCRLETQGLLRPSEKSVLVVPGEAQILSLKVNSGEEVRAGELVVELLSPDLEFQLQAAQIRAKRLEWQVGVVTMQPKLHEQKQIIRAEQQRAAAEIRGIEALLAKYRLYALQAGVLYWSQQDMAEGGWVGENELLGQIVQPETQQVYTYLQQQDLARIRPGDIARFYSESGRIAPLELNVSRIDMNATRVLTDGMLASTSGGDILVRRQREQLIPENAIYRVTLALNEKSMDQIAGANLTVLRGKVVILGARRAWAWKYWRSAIALIRREAGF